MSIQVVGMYKLEPQQLSFILGRSTLYLVAILCRGQENVWPLGSQDGDLKC